DRAPLRWDGTRPCALPQARAHDGRRRDRDERTRQGLRVHGAATRKRRQLTKDFKMLLRPVLNLLHRVMTRMAHRVTSRQRSTSVAFGAKRTLTEPRLQKAGFMLALSKHRETPLR